MKSAALLVLWIMACGGTTGSALVSFGAEASGPPDASGSLTFQTSENAVVSLTLARLHIGAIYLNESRPTSGAAAEPCVSPGIYVGQVFGPLDVDLLSGSSQAFPGRGEGMRSPAKTAEVWLTGGDVNAVDDPTVILELEGSAVQNATTFPFVAQLTIGANRQTPVTNPALPSANPICHRRIVTPIVIDLTPTEAGTLDLRIDPAAIVDGVDFSALPALSDGSGRYEIPDISTGEGGALYRGLTANSGVYDFTWKP